MLSKEYLYLNQEEIEDQIFIAITTSFDYYGIGENLLNYIIFDYKISDRVVDTHTLLSDTIKGMFETRKLQAELSVELESSTSISSNKKIKV